jgi:hypothetical protein
MRGSALLENLLNKVGASLRQPNVVAYFIVLAALHAVLSIAAWGTSSGYEDSAIPYFLPALLGLVEIGILGAIAWRYRS